jgi:hypothetical protein
MTRFPLAAPADLNSKAKDMALPGPSTRAVRRQALVGNEMAAIGCGAKMELYEYAGQAGDRAVRGGKDTVK